MDNQEVNEAPKYMTESECAALINYKLYHTRKEVGELSTTTSYMKAAVVLYLAYLIYEQL